MEKKFLILFLIVSVCDGGQTEELQPADARCRFMEWGQEQPMLTCRIKKRNRPGIFTGELIGRAINPGDDGSNDTSIAYPGAITLMVYTYDPLTIKPDSMKVLPNLTQVHIYGNYKELHNLTISSNEFRHTLNLKIIHVEGFRLPNSTLQSIRSANALERLILDAVRMPTTLTADVVGSMNSLEHLSLQRNSIEFIEPGTFDGLHNLKHINLTRNGYIASLPPNLFKECKKLVEVDLSHNQIKSFQNLSFDKLDSVAELNLRYNEIARIRPGDLDSLKNLKNLDLEVNEIQYIEDGAFRNSSLHHLHLGENYLGSIKSSMFKGLTSLESLNLHSSQSLRKIESGAFDDLINLRRLWMTFTEVTTLPNGLFNKMTKLEMADLSSNCFDNLSRSNFTHCHKLQTLKLTNCTI